MGAISREAANANIQTMNIRGKEYATVPARIDAFWSVYPEGEIYTEEVLRTDDEVEFKAFVYRAPGVRMATGHAAERRMTAEERAAVQAKLDATPASDWQTRKKYENQLNAVNESSMVENCETSAIGRALGAAGFGSREAIASAEEMQRAIAQDVGGEYQEKPRSQKQAAKTLEEAAAEYERVMTEYANRARGGDLAGLVAQHERYLGGPNGPKPRSEWTAAEFLGLVAKVPGA